MVCGANNRSAVLKSHADDFSTLPRAPGIMEAVQLAIISKDAPLTANKLTNRSRADVSPDKRIANYAMVFKLCIDIIRNTFIAWRCWQCTNGI